MGNVNLKIVFKIAFVRNPFLEFRMSIGFLPSVGYRLYDTFSDVYNNQLKIDQGGKPKYWV